MRASTCWSKTRPETERTPTLPKQEGVKGATYSGSLAQLCWGEGFSRLRCGSGECLPQLRYAGSHHSLRRSCTSPKKLALGCGAEPSPSGSQVDFLGVVLHAGDILIHL